MDKEFDSKLTLQGNSSSNGETISRSKSFAFKAPQENFTYHDFELGKIYGVGSYSKVSFFLFFSHFFSCKNLIFSAIWFES
jgi:3-phosphoinositide dependent protein kinase-1